MREDSQHDQFHLVAREANGKPRVGSLIELGHNIGGMQRQWQLSRVNLRRSMVRQDGFCSRNSMHRKYMHITIKLEE